MQGSRDKVSGMINDSVSRPQNHHSNIIEKQLTLKGILLMLGKEKVTSSQLRCIKINRNLESDLFRIK